ncbi:MAG: 8-oxoguanine DNA glycosylase, partial [Candidatus Syntropharchaeia archaeon]
TEGNWINPSGLTCYFLIQHHTHLRLNMSKLIERIEELKIQDKLGPEGFLETPLGKLSEILKEEGHRFYKKRAKFIVEARKFDIKENVISFENEREARRWLVENVRGIGYKEGSHFLRNVGYEDVSISKRERY